MTFGEINTGPLSIISYVWTQTPPSAISLRFSKGEFSFRSLDASDRESTPRTLNKYGPCALIAAVAVFISLHDGPGLRAGVRCSGRHSSMGEYSSFANISFRVHFTVKLIRTKIEEETIFCQTPSIKCVSVRNVAAKFYGKVWVLGAF